MSKFSDLLASKSSVKQYLVEIYAYNKQTAQIEALYYSTGGFVTRPSDTPANQPYRGRLKSAFSFTQTLFSGGNIGGHSTPGYGALVLNNDDGVLDGLRNYAFDGRRVRVLLGGEDFVYTDFGVIFDGTADGISFGLTDITIRLRDLQYKFEKPIQNNLFAGSGGWEGSSDLQGKPKPWAFGQLRNIQPVIVDAVNLRFAVSWRAVQSINNGRDQGVPLTFSADYPSLATLDSASIPAGNYATCVAQGVGKLGSAPAGVLTFDVQGDSVGGYASSAADIIQRIVTTAGDFSAADLDGSSFSALNASISAPLGLYVVDDLNIIDALDLVSNSIGGWYGFNRSAKMIVGRLEAPSGLPADSYSAAQVMGIERVATALPTWRTRLGWRRNWSTLSLSDMAASYRPGGLNAAQLQAFTEEYRYVTASDPSVQTIYLLAQDTQIDTLIDSSADAIAEATRQNNLYKTQRDIYRLALKIQPFARKLGDVIEVKLNRYGLDVGRLFSVIGIKEDTLANLVTLELWG